MAELDLILRKNEEARSLDMNHFYDTIRIAQDSDDQILKVLKSSQATVRFDEHTPIRYLGCQVISFRKPLLHCIRYSCCRVCLLFLIVNSSVLRQSITTATLNVNFLIGG